MKDSNFFSTLKDSLGYGPNSEAIRKISEMFGHVMDWREPYVLGPDESEMASEAANKVAENYGSRHKFRIVVRHVLQERQTKLQRFMSLLASQITRKPKRYAYVTMGKYDSYHRVVFIYFFPAAQSQFFAKTLAHEVHHHLMMQDWDSFRLIWSNFLYTTTRLFCVVVCGASYLLLAEPSLVWTPLIALLVILMWQLTSYRLHPREVAANRFAKKHWREFLPAIEEHLVSPSP